MKPEPTMTTAIELPEGFARDRWLADLGAHCLTLIDDMRQAMRQDHWPRLERYEAEYDGDYSARVTGDQTGSGQVVDSGRQAWHADIFKYSNLSLGLRRSMVRYQSASVFEALFGSRPWMSMRARRGAGLVADEAGERLQSWALHKLGNQEANVEPAAKDILQSAFKLGYGVAKATHAVDRERYKTRKRVLVVDGEPVRLRDGTPVDPTTPRDYLDGGGAPVPMLVDAVAVSFGPPDIAVVVPRAKMQWEEMLVEAEDILWDGPRLHSVYYKNFLWDISAPSLGASAAVAELYSMAVGTLRRLWGDGLAIPEEAYLALLSAAGSDPGSPERAPRTSEGGSSGEGRRWFRLGDEEYVDLAEVYLEYPLPDKEGGSEVDRTDASRREFAKLFVVVALDSGEVIYCDYLGNITPRARLPYEIIPFDRIAGRAYGVGYFQRYESEEYFADAHFNGIHWRNQWASNPPRAIDKSAFQETHADDGDINWAPGLALTKRGQASLKEAIEQIELPSLEEGTQWLLQRMEHQMGVDSGVTPTAQGDISRQPHLDTATAIRHVVGQGQVMRQLPLSELRMGFERILSKMVELAFSKMEEGEQFPLPGPGGGVDVVEPEDVGGVMTEIELIMARYQETEAVQRINMVFEKILLYYQQIPEVQARLQPLLEKLLRQLSIAGAEQIIEPLPMPVPTAMPPDAGGAPPAEGAAPSAPTGGGLAQQPEGISPGTATATSGDGMAPVGSPEMPR